MSGWEACSRAAVAGPASRELEKLRQRLQRPSFPRGRLQRDAFVRLRDLQRDLAAALRREEG
jgi:hypothetical protein